MTNITCRIIVQRGNQYFVADARHLFGNSYKPVFRQYIYDAKGFKNVKAAHEKAKAVGGRVRLFDALNGDFI